MVVYDRVKELKWSAERPSWSGARNVTFRAELRQGAPRPARNPVVTPQGRGRLRIMAISFGARFSGNFMIARRTMRTENILTGNPFLALLFRAMCMVGRLVARHASRSSSRRALVCCQHLPPTVRTRVAYHMLSKPNSPPRCHLSCTAPMRLRRCAASTSCAT